MKRIIYTPIRILVVAALVIGGVFSINSMRSTESSQDEVPVVPVGASVLNLEESIRYLEDQARTSPDHVGYQLSLAQAYLQFGVQSRQEPIYIPKAEKLIKDIRGGSPDLFEGKALQAALYNILHEFEKARDLALTLIEENGEVAYVYGILIDALVELGQYEDAVIYCDEMLSIKPGVASYARASYLRELHGDTQGATEAMKLAADAAMYGSHERSWALYQLGQLYLAENKLPIAAKIFNGILEESPGYAFAIGGVGQIHLIQGEYDKAIHALRTAYEWVPADEFLEGLVEAYEAVGEDELMYEALDLIERGYKEADEMGENVNMEYADFLADVDQDLKKALRLAEKEYQRRPGHLHALETYAWTLHKRGRSEEAIPYVEKAMRLGTGDAMVYYRAAEIYSALPDYESALEYLQKALDANLHIESPLSALQAQRQFDKLSTL